jgi:acyl dehydratase
MPEQDMIDHKWIGHSSDPIVLDIERGRLKFFAKAIGETNPIYFDEAAARAAGYRDLPVPPTFLIAAEFDSNSLFGTLDKLGVPLARILHGEQGYTYHKPVYAGDTVTVVPRITDIYDKKNGALEFIVRDSKVTNSKDELVAEIRTVIVVRN